jgi:predicted GNAT family N-acyltransferase
MNNVYIQITSRCLAVLDITPWNTDWYISRILVPSPYREMGYGTELMQRCLLEQPPGTDMYVHPTKNYGSDVQRLIGFFERFEFQQVPGVDHPYMKRSTR